MLAARSSFLGASALLLSSLGVFGLVSFHVARRTNEIGVRMALGATPRGVARMIVRDASRLVGLGLLAGLALAVPLARLIGALLYGVSVTCDGLARIEGPA